MKISVKTRIGWERAEEWPALLALLAVCTAFLVSGSANPFLYFRF